MAVLSIGRLITHQARRDPHAPALTHEGRTVTRGAFEARTNQLARAFSDLGVTAGRMVTIALPNGIAFYEAAVAAWKLGAVPQPVSARLPIGEFAAIVALADPALIVGGPPLETDRPHLATTDGWGRILQRGFCPIASPHTGRRRPPAAARAGPS